MCFPSPPPVAGGIVFQSWEVQNLIMHLLVRLISYIGTLHGVEVFTNDIPAVIQSGKWADCDTAGDVSDGLRVNFTVNMLLIVR